MPTRQGDPRKGDKVWDGSRHYPNGVIYFVDYKERLCWVRFYDVMKLVPGVSHSSLTGELMTAEQVRDEQRLKGCKGFQFSELDGCWKDTLGGHYCVNDARGR